MIDRAQICVTSSVETALKKLGKADIAVYGLKKRGAYVYFCVEEEYVQKVFAIFSHPCYNVGIRRKSAKSRLKNFVGRRLGLLIGGAMFVAACALSNFFVLKIKVVGSGSYLGPQIIDLAKSCDVERGRLCTHPDFPMLTSRILSMPGVSFCSVQKAGGVVVIDVRAESGGASYPKPKSLVSGCGGEVVKIVALCGTAEKGVGDRVEKGDTLIGGYALTENGERIQTPAVGFAHIKCTRSISLFYEKESDKNAADALSSTLLYTDEPLEKSYSVSPCDGGVKYELKFSYITALYINMD